MFKNNSAAAALCFVVFASGVFAQDLQTLADNAAKSPDKVLKLSGEYYLSKPLELTRAHSGLVIDGQGKTLISAGVKVSGWTKDGNVWKAKVGASEIEALFVDGKRANVASDGRQRIMCGELEADPNSGFKARDEDLRQLEGLSESELKRVYFDMYHVWCNVHGRLVSLEKLGGGATAVKILNPEGRTPYKWETAPRFVICNVRSQLDEKGEYYFSPEEKTLYYIPRDGEDIATVRAYYPVADCALKVSGKSRAEPVENLKITGVRFAHGGHFPQPSDRQHSQAASSNGGFLRFNYAKNVVFEDNRVEHTNLYGLDFKNGVDGALVKNCEFFDCGSGGVRVGPMRELPESESTTAVVLRNNIIWQYGRYNKAGIGIIIFDSGGNTVQNNTIFDGYYSGMSIGWTWGFGKTKTQNNKIIDNRIFKIGFGLLCDMGGIYTLGDATGSVISGNEISEVRRHRYGGWGIYNDEGSANYLITKNYVHDTQDDTYFQHYGKNNLVKNNVFKCGEVSQVGVGRMSKEYPDELVYANNVVVYKSPAILLRNNKPITTYTAKFSKNLYWNEAGDVKFADMNLAEWQAKENQDAGSIVEDPKLDGYTPKSSAYKTIGFEPFKIKAGVRGKMRARLNEILDGYEFPAFVDTPLCSPWGINYRENLSASKLGGQPVAGKIKVAKRNNEVAVLEENGVRFIRFTDSKREDQQYLPMIAYTISSAENSVGMVSFEMRVNESSNFFVECRGDTGHKAPAVDIIKGTLFINGARKEIPLGKWLKVEMTFKVGADKSFGVKILDGDKTIIDERATYPAKPMTVAESLIVSQTSNEDGATFDIRKIAYSNLK